VSLPKTLFVTGGSGGGIPNPNLGDIPQSAPNRNTDVYKVGDLLMITLQMPDLGSRSDVDAMVETRLK
jgi:hypothetical protein